MADELMLLIDSETGALLVEGTDRLADPIRAALDHLMGPSQTIGCAAPLDIQTLLPASDDEITQTDCVRIAGFWHNSLIEGPGRRTVVQLQGCPIRCLGFIFSLAGAATWTTATDSPSTRWSSPPSAQARPHQQSAPLPFWEAACSTSGESEGA